MSGQTLANFETLEVISSKGANNAVKIFKARIDQRVVCVKSFTSRKLSVVQDALNEAKLLLKAASHHPSICQMFDCFVDQVDSKFCFSIVMEHFERGDLESEIKKRKQANLAWDDVQLLEIFGDLINALATLQKHSICHRDLKPQNILNAGRNCFKIGDFGVSKQELFSGATNTLAGTPIYFSPLCAKAYRAAELLGEDVSVQHNMYKSDVFSLGLTFLRMAGLASIRGLNSRGQNLIDSRISELRYSSEVKWLIDRMLRVNELERPDFLALDRVYQEIQHPVLFQCIQPYVQVPAEPELVLDEENSDRTCSQVFKQIIQAIAGEYTVEQPLHTKVVRSYKEDQEEVDAEVDTLESVGASKEVAEVKPGLENPVISREILDQEQRKS